MFDQVNTSTPEQQDFPLSVWCAGSSAIMNKPCGKTGGNEQTCSLQLSDSVSLWTYWVLQTVQCTCTPAREKLRMIISSRTGLSWSVDDRETFIKGETSKCMMSICRQLGQLGQLGQTQDHLSWIWRRAGDSPSQIITGKTRVLPCGKRPIRIYDYRAHPIFR